MGVNLCDAPQPAWLPMIFEMYVKFESRETYAH